MISRGRVGCHAITCYSVYPVAVMHNYCDQVLDSVLCISVMAPLAWPVRLMFRPSWHDTAKSLLGQDKKTLPEFVGNVSLGCAPETEMVRRSRVLPSRTGRSPMGKKTEVQFLVDLNQLSRSVNDGNEVHCRRSRWLLSTTLTVS